MYIFSFLQKDIVEGYFLKSERRMVTICRGRRGKGRGRKRHESKTSLNRSYYSFTFGVKELFHIFRRLSL